MKLGIPDLIDYGGAKMEQLIDKSFDFSIRVTELIRYLEEEEKAFPLRERLLACATGIGVCARQTAASGSMSPEANQKALGYASEAEYLLELMAKTGYLTEKQSRLIIGDCQGLRTMITELSCP